MTSSTDPAGGSDPSGVHDRARDRDPDVTGWTDARTELLELVLTTETVEEHLHQLSVTASAVSRSIAACGVTLRREGNAWTVAASDDLASAVDEVQYGLGTGPCLESLATGRTLTIRDTVHEDRWEGYPAHALSFGVRSSHSVPLAVAHQTVGALNAYATAPDVFDDALTAQLREFASQAEVAIALALHRAEQDALVDQLHQAMQSRSVIDQALGILMARQRCTADEAFAILRSASQSRNRKIAAIAEDLVTATTGQAPRPGHFER